MRDRLTEKTIDRDMLSSLFGSFLGTHILDDLVSFFVDAYIAVILGRLTDAIISHDADYLKNNLILICACLIFKIICEPLIFAFFSAKSVLGSCSFARKLLLHYLDKPYEYIAGNQAGDIPSRIDNDIMDFVREKLKQTADRILLPFFAVCMIFILCRYNLLYAVISLLASLATYAAPILMRNRLAKFDKSNREYRSAYNTTETELAANASTLRSMEREERLIAGMERLFGEFREKTLRRELNCAALSDTVSGICRFAARIVIIVSGAFLLGADKISYGEISTMLALVSSFSFLFDKAAGLITVSPILNNLYERLKFFYDASERVYSEKETLPTDSRSIVEGRNLTVRYEDKTVFEDFSFSVPRNRITLIKGANGSGKSTLVKCICGFASVASGELLIDGKRPEKAAFGTISLASQSSTLFGYTGIRENIQLGCLGKENAARVDALMAAYRLEDNGTDVCNLSGGEAQKAKILRALVNDAELLILDEPENHLDENTLKHLTRELAGHRKSVLIVSHCDGFDGIADNIIVVGAET